jgi:hypothetical protein
MLSQIGDNDKLHLTAFHSKKFELANINYETHDKELLAITVDFVGQWLQFSEGLPYQIIVYNDHKNLTYFENGHALN